ncbi:hypothetical protein IGB42_02044 [Andreprevotia sp. IGB-42]|uniref:hypothetical protein n=1 Tax=Andreprevotia sp. IGB-42 TaxID=2497473 RepID=UPI00135CB172|nr:hypothetical protein [Andreprevotia sp. IGB-42]KAF0813691.1 hypothetical protein IGB42_02044 [Andreprevotia sp. IGB-42]
MPFRFLLLLLCALCCSRLALAGQPALNPNDWNFVLVPSFDSQTGKGNTLSVSGLNHALRFGQLLNSMLAGKQGQVRQVYAFSYTNDDSMVPLQTIEPYALLNNLGVSVQKLSVGDASVYNSPAYFMQQLLGNQPRGTYIMAMPPAMLQQVAGALGNGSISIDGTHQYVVLSGRDQPFATSSYDDQIKDVADYPVVPLPARSACPQSPVTIRAKAPGGWRPYTEQTVYLVRHVEAHPTGNFENGNYVCQGQWRALGANGRLLEIMRNRKPDYVFTSDPSNIIGCSGTCSYIRPSLTVSPFAVQHKLPLTLATFQWSDATDLAQSLFNRESPYFKHPDSGASILVGWEHAHIQKAVQYLLETMYRNPEAAKQLPAWSFEDYDTVWALSTSKDGELTFRNTCEAIPTAALPSTCPAFFQ